MKSIKRNANMHRGRHVIRFYSKKNGCVLKLEGFLELWLACKLENDASVQCFASQPEEIAHEIEGKTRRFTPDFLVEYTDGTNEYIEIHHEQLTDAEYEARVKAFS
ncbi:TnsA endonuclease N-terminal domain-containing protein [Pseudoalteromonas lipolytica]